MSADIISLEAERGRRDQPDPEHVMDDGDGGTLLCFSALYDHNGVTHELDLWAYDFADAERQIAGIRASLQLVGQVMARTEE